jgi:tRNA threonylcarbamoyladenosine biosynthesis protein TsaE
MYFTSQLPAMENIMHFSLENIAAAARWFWLVTGNHSVFAFHGQMGAGKTTFIKALCTDKGITDVVTSPSFSLVNEYRLPDGGSIFHIDLYRIRDEEEARLAGIEDVLYSGSLGLVEWPEKAPGIFPPGTLDVYLDIMPDGSRRIKLESTSEV